MKLKDKKIEILRQITTRDQHGFGTTTLEPISAPVWAYFRQLSGKEVFAAATTNYKEEVLFTVNYNPEITNTHVIRSTDKTLSECSEGALRQTRQRPQRILCVFTRTLTQYGGKQTASNEMVLSVLRIKRYNGVLYDITRVDTFEGYKEDITLYCKRRARQ